MGSSFLSFFPMLGDHFTDRGFKGCLISIVSDDLIHTVFFLFLLAAVAFQINLAFQSFTYVYVLFLQ